MIVSPQWIVGSISRGGGRNLTKIHPGSGNWSSGDGGKSGGGRGEGLERVAIGRSVGFKIIQNGETPLRPGPAFLTRYKKERGGGTGCGKAADIFIRSSTGNRIDMERESIMHVPRPNSPLLLRHSSSPSLYALDLTPAIRKREMFQIGSIYLRYLFLFFIFFPWEKVARVNLQ